MADLSWGEIVGGGIAGVLAGIGATLKALGDRRNGDRRSGNGNGYTTEMHALDKRVLTVELGLQHIGNTLLGIKDDVAEIKAIVDRRN